jgi:16S rRNA (adenine1518-N6/adenine1519-N6)-dimethyltransferase
VASVLYRPSKKLGQNFLTDKHIASLIVSHAELTNSDTVLEPGAGFGTLTRLLGDQAGHVLAIEKDPRLASHLRKEFAENSKISIIEGDVLRINIPTFNKVVGTPSYNLSSKLILFLTRKRFELASLVFQKEFGQRLFAKVGTADYGRLSITAQRSLIIQPIMTISPTAFRPRPKVDSILLRISPQRTQTVENEEFFELLVRGLFNQRRRVVKGSLIHFLSGRIGAENARATVEAIRLPEKRVYQLTISEIEQLSRQLSETLAKRGLMLSESHVSSGLAQRQ